MVRGVAILLVTLVAAIGAASSAAIPTSQLAVSRISCRPCWVGLALISPSGGRPAILSRHVGWEDNDPVFSPDGKWIAFSRTTDGYRSDHLYLMRSDGRAVHQLTNGRFDERPAWSPKGGWIAYQSMRGIELIRPDGSGRHVVKGTSQASAPAWSPDGSRLTFAQQRNVWTAQSDGSRRHRLVAGYDPDWAPNGRTIAFMPPNGGVAVVSAGGGRSRFLGTGMDPAWSPDSKQIAFTRWPADNRFYVWVMNADGSRRHLVLTNARAPSWRPIPPA